LSIPADQIDENAISRAIHAAQLEQFVSNLPEGLDTMVGERGIRLSGGQRQRIGMARALYHDPPVLVLDEAISSLDTATERNVMEAVRSLKGSKTLFIVAHRVSPLRTATICSGSNKGVWYQKGKWRWCWEMFQRCRQK
jgi:ABC-type bacteriocin/lantibiotic exporter with double-glycine peptidase domain